MVVHSVLSESVAEALQIQPGDTILAVNGRTDLEDLFDYQFEVLGSEYLELQVRHTDGSEEIYEIEKDPEDDVGLIFTSPVFTPIKTCNNRCPFCFIDQQPKGLRASLYIKDDDYRLSYFNNTYITLSNLTPRDRERIARLRPGPLYVSVHATTPAVREQLLMNPQAGNILEELCWLKNLEIPFHCQIVVCPGINDGPILAQSLEDLAELRPEALSVAVVPVGLTQYRSHLPELVPVGAEAAQDVIRVVEAFEKSMGPGFVYLSDEFYLKADLPFPQYDLYGEFPQLDDGVGTARLLLQDFFELEKRLPPALEPPANYLLLSGKLGAMIMQPMLTRLNEIEGLYVDILPVENQFWGQAVDVAGLVTGQDIITTLQKHDISGYRAIIIPSVMLKQSTDTFLDGTTVDDVSQTLQVPFQVVADSYSARELLEILLPALKGLKAG